MRALNYLIILLIFFSCTNEKKTTNPEKELNISAEVKGFDNNTDVKLIDGSTGKILDSTKINSNHFYLSQRIDSPPKSLFLTIGKQAIELFVGNENIIISGNKVDIPYNLKIKGSENQNTKNKLDKKIQSLNDKRMEYLQKMFKLRSENKWNDTLQREYWGKNGLISTIDNKIDSITKDFIFKNINSSFALNNLIINKSQYSKSEIKKLLKKLDKKYSDSEYGKVLKLYVENPILEEGSKYVDFKSENQNGRVINFSSLVTNDFTLLEFASPYCSWCKKALPMIKRISQNNRINIVTVWIDKNKKDWIEYYKANDINWTMLWDKKGRFSEAYTKYNIYGTPTYFLIDKDGKIIKIWKDYDENMEQKIKELINNAV